MTPLEHSRFMRDFAARAICGPKSLDTGFFAAEAFDIVDVLETSHLRGLAEILCPYSEAMVRAFYFNLTYRDGELRSRVCGTDIVMTAPVWMEILGFDFDGQETVPYDPDTSALLPGYHRVEAAAEARRDDVRRVFSAIFGVGYLSMEARILHYSMTHILFPRGFNHSRVLEGDLPVLWAIRHGVQVNWRQYICGLMVKAKHKGHLPYACLIQKILEHFEVPMDGEQLVKPKSHHAKFGKRLLEQCKISKIGGVWQLTSHPEPEVPDVQEVAAEVDDDVDPEDMQEIPEPTCGFTMSDVMRGVNALIRSVAKIAKGRKRSVQKGNERFRHIQGRFRQIEDRLTQLEGGGGSRGQEAAHPEDQADVSDEEEDYEDDDDAAEE